MTEITKANIEQHFALKNAMKEVWCSYYPHDSDIVSLILNAIVQDKVVGVWRRIWTKTRNGTYRKRKVHKYYYCYDTSSVCAVFPRGIPYYISKYFFKLAGK